MYHTEYIIAVSTEINNKQIPKADTFISSFLTTSINTPISEMIIPTILFQCTFSLTSNQAKRGENKGIVLRITDAIVALTIVKPYASQIK